MSSINPPSLQRRDPHWLWMLALLASGCWLLAVCWHEWLSDPLLAASFDCEGVRRWLIRQLGGRLAAQPLGAKTRVPFEYVLILQFSLTLFWWLCGAAVLAWRRRIPFTHGLLVWGTPSGWWSLLAGSWTVWRLLASVIGWTSAEIVFNLLPEMWLSFALAGWGATFVCLFLGGKSPPQTNTDETPGRVPAAVWIAVVAYTLIFGMMNTLLYQNLLIPHGDSAMYEEHLWNLLHGKGFRSFIDKGLFLGEHIQVIHLGLIPLYLVWPSHLLLEWCESLGLAWGAIPVFRMAVRQTGSRWQAACLAGAYLLYLPMQRLDISIDFKTFRPEAFGIPLLLAAFDALDLRRWKTCGAWLFAALLVKEDYALIIGPLGIWLALREFRRVSAETSRWRRLWPGIVLALAAVVYLWWAVKIAIPYFKAGNEVHYAKYFSQFGQTTNEIVYNLLRRPDWLLSELITAENFLFGAALCFSLAWLPLWSPSRLAVGMPLFAALCLNQIARNTQHHFHAPLVAIVFWAAAHGLANIGRFGVWVATRTSHLNSITSDGARFAVLMTLFTAAGMHFWHSFTPAGLPFWDAHSGANWHRKYVPTTRASQFAEVLRRIPPDRHVASTDFVHPRFNHHARSYDYSSYRPDVPADVEYLVIDVRGPYSDSRAQSALDVPEYQRHPERWELLPDDTQGYFYVFKRRSAIRRPDTPHGQN